MARKTKYDPNTFPLLAEGYAREGLRDCDIAKKLGIALSSYYKYENLYTEFAEAIKRGKLPVDFEVENSLLKRAKGYTYEETTKIMSLDKEGNPQLRETKVVKKEIAPDVGAQAFWLKNRNPQKWRDKREVEVSGEFTTPSIIVEDEEIANEINKIRDDK